MFQARIYAFSLEKLNKFNITAESQTHWQKKDKNDENAWKTMKNNGEPRKVFWLFFIISSEQEQ